MSKPDLQFTHVKRPDDDTADREQFRRYFSTFNDAYKQWRFRPEMQHFYRHRSEMALLLENQRLMQASYNDDGSDFQKYGIALVAEILRGFVAFDLVPVQPMLGPCSIVYYLRCDKMPRFFSDTSDAYECETEFAAREILARTKKLKAYRNPYFEDLRTGEAERRQAYLSAATEIRDEMSREILADLRNNAGTLMNAAAADALDPDKVYGCVQEMHQVIRRKTNDDANSYWIVTGPALAKRLEPRLDNPVDWSAVNCIENLGIVDNRYWLIVDPLFPADQILCGAYNRLIEGYVYAPYVVVTPTPTVIDPEGFIPRRGYLTRCGKVLLSAKPYGLIRFNKE